MNNAYNRYCAEGLKQVHTAKEIDKRRRPGGWCGRVPLAAFTLYRGHVLPTMELAGALILEYCLLLFFYGYSEATILHEAYHAVPQEKRKVLEGDGKPAPLSAGSSGTIAG